MEKALTNRTPWKGIISFMFPVFMGLLLQQLYNTADTIIVGNFVFAKPIVAAFGLGSAAAGYCVSHVRCVAVCLIPFASYFPILGLFLGANNALYSTFVATSALAVRVISTYTLQEIPAIGYRMIWWNALLGWGLGCIITWVHFYRGKWRPHIGDS